MPAPGPRIVVTGLGAVTPIGLTVPDYWDGMMRGQSGAGPITRFDASEFTTTFACELKGFDPVAHIDRKEARRLDRYAQYAVVAADEAIRDAGLDAADEADRARVGVVYGSGIGGIGTFQEQVLVMGEHGPRRISPFLIPMQISDIASGVIAMRHGFRGPNYATVSACATSNNAIADAWMILKAGLTDAMVCGGSEAAVVEIAVGGFAAMRALSTRNDSPETASRPFDATRDGFVMGEGAGTLVLETLDRAQARGAHIYAEMIGLGMSADAYHMTAPHPEGEGAALAMRMALDTAGLAPERIDYLNMHGTSTPLGDVAETKAIKEVFGEHAYAMSLSSTKSMTGHLLGAAGAVEAIAALLAIEHGRIPPTINFETPDPECDLDYTFNTPQERAVDVVLSNAFGFGGHNTSVIFTKYEAEG
ncbi:MAG: beta-ketoacyl-ACP synthase II [Rubricoccaceae bacterium]|nr:beta-ketoacyl-ACP synthase II [Rubricoccaceae bacterium]